MFCYFKFIFVSGKGGVLKSSMIHKKPVKQYSNYFSMFQNTCGSNFRKKMNVFVPSTTESLLMYYWLKKKIYLLQLLLVTLIFAVAIMNSLKYFLFYLFLHIIKLETAILTLNFLKGHDPKTI